MRSWWVNQHQTSRQEVAGGYLWSPKVRSNGTRNPYYESMRGSRPASGPAPFADTRLRAFGIARSYAYEAPKPRSSVQWAAIGMTLAGVVDV